MSAIAHGGTEAPKASYRRSLLPLLFSTAYVAALALRTGGTHSAWAWTHAALALLLSAGAARFQERTLLFGFQGLALVLASLAAVGWHPWASAFGCIGAGIASASAGYSLKHSMLAVGARITTAKHPPSVLMTIAGPLLLWTFIGGLQVASKLGGSLEGVQRYAPTAVEFGAVLALSGLLISAMKVANERRLELGFVDRMRACKGVIGLTILCWFAGEVSRSGVLGGERMALVEIAAASVFVVWISMRGDAIAIARATRKGLVMALVAGPVVVTGVVSSLRWPALSPFLLLPMTTIALAIGAMASTLERPLRPARGAWLDAVASARHALLRAHPDDAVAMALASLRTATTPALGSPELFLLAPARVVRLDAAGFARERETSWPEEVATFALHEPEGIVRTEMLDTLQVRRPELRPIAQWMADRKTLLASLIVREGEIEGLLLLPRGERRTPVCLEEVRAIRALADELALVCSWRGAFLRSCEREQKERQRAEGAEDKIAALEHLRTLEGQRAAQVTTTLSRLGDVAMYSPAMRTAAAAVESYIHNGAAVALQTPSGIDPVGYLAQAHLSSARPSSPFVVVDCTSSREHEPARWKDRLRSPLALASRGLLVLLDVGALPSSIQQLIGDALAEKHPPWAGADAIDVALAVTAAQPLVDLIAQEKIHTSLASQLSDAAKRPVIFPRLRERPEDFRSILLDGLAREGLRVLGRPVGIEEKAYALLVEYPFPGEKDELASIVRQLVAVCARDVVREGDVQSLGLHLSPG